MLLLLLLLFEFFLEGFQPQVNFFQIVGCTFFEEVFGVLIFQLADLCLQILDLGMGLPVGEHRHKNLEYSEPLR